METVEKEVIKEVIKEVEKPLFSAPKIDGKCISPVKNIDDPRLEPYAYSLYVSDWSDIGFKLSRAQFVELVVQAAKVDVRQVTVLQKMEVSRHFEDVAINDWYTPYLYYAYSK